jgi:polyisoprenoid-binding protein YceI
MFSTSPIWFRVVAGAAALFAASSLAVAETVRYSPVPNSSKLRMDGTSTIHDWHAETDVIGGFLELDATFSDASGKSAPSTIKPKVEVKIPVRSLKSSGGKKMDAVMQEHMKFEQHKAIEYRVLELVPKAGGASGGTAQFDARGTLTIAGVTKTNTMPVTIERIDSARLKVKGTAALKMTDFGIKPPAPEILGLSVIKTGDDLKLTFEWVTEKKAE